MDEKLNSAFPPRNLPEEILRQVGAVSPYRQIASCSSDGDWFVEGVPDSGLVSLLDEEDYLVCVNSHSTGLYPSDIAVLYALALFGLFPELRGRKCLCVDSELVDVQALRSILERGNLRLLYSSTPTISELADCAYKPEVMRISYRGQVIWNGEIPESWQERLISEERFRRYNLMFSRINETISHAFKTRSNYLSYRLPRTTNPIEAVRRLGLGYIEYDLEQDIEAPSFAKTQIDMFVESNVSFSKITDILENVELTEPNYRLLQDTASVWKNIAFDVEMPEAIDLLSLPLEEIADTHALDTYIDALACGVPLEDLLA